MISNCPHCKKDMNLSDVHKAKIESAIVKLKPGKFLKFGCPVCKKTIELSADTGQEKDLSADLDQEKTGKPKPAAKKTEAAKPEKTPEKPKDAKKKEDDPKPVNPPPDPPKAPDISWLAGGTMDEKEVIEDVPTALIMMPDGQDLSTISESFKKINYQLFLPKSVNEAIAEMRFTDYASIVFHSDFEGVKLEDSEFHAHMRKMAMVKRRYIYYVLIGPGFSTLYDLQALAFSANIVVNEKEISHFDILLKKGKADYDLLFAPYLAMLKSHGKR